MTFTTTVIPVDYTCGNSTCKAQEKYVPRHMIYFLANETTGPLHSCPVAVSTAARVVMQKVPFGLGTYSQTRSIKIKLIDFGIARSFKHYNDILSKYDPLSEERHIIGTLDWASLNAYDGIDLALRDDLESLAYTALFILRVNLAWKRPPSIHREPYLRAMQRVQVTKAATSGDKLGIGFPPVFDYLLDYSRGLELNRIPDHEGLNRQLAGVRDHATVARRDRLLISLRRNSKWHCRL
ncbi:hypothetical protein D9756_011115 [Leucocoprinus leucothites]|uniref:Protein kinase domain-containing protein n=1 Tax=Leucocoprinus leucothites TaxID=201217 RepID=A0A8H5CUS7_9AGAR|nr:hypothetical protein D9756_011115 [Leucoagaricus leucothites]